MPTSEVPHPNPDWPTFAAGAGLAALMASGIVIALESEIEIPAPIVVAALVVAVVAAFTVASSVWITSRRQGIGIFRALGRTLRALGRLILDFF